ncbi:hypothetical protein C2S51_010353 [Perilla frutescens var. frutescens]|nr:hypothetical protein C2S51_010353 [Perilla frutescens var. frutescens]
MPPRMKNPNIGAHEEVEEKDFTTRYNCPFPLKTEWEGQLYTKLNQSMVTMPRYFDWDLLKDLKIVTKVTKYLKVLGLEHYAKHVDYSGYGDLCYKFLSTMYVIDDHKKLGVRMNGRDYQISLPRMKTVFGFPTGGERERPNSFSVEAGWRELSGLTIRIIQEQTNKVNANEVYLFCCALRGTKVCISNFIWSAMRQMQTRAGMHPSFSHIVTGLAHNFGILSATMGYPEGHDEIRPYSIDFSELKGAQIIKDRFTLLPPDKRLCVSRHTNEEIVKRQGDSDAGPSIGGDEGGNEDEEMEEEEKEEEEEEQPEQSPHTMSGDYYGRFHNDLMSFREHIDASFGSLRQEIHDGYEAHTQQMNARFDAHTQHMNARFDAQDAQIAFLQAQWDTWTAFYPPSHPPPPN